MIGLKIKAIILVGLPGSGKTTASIYFKDKKIPVVRMGEVTQEQLAKNNLPVTEENEDIIRKNLRNNYGPDVYARKTLEKVKRDYSDAGVVIIDGMRTKAEYDFFHKYLDDINILYFETEKTMRFTRLRMRKIRPLSEKDAVKRDRVEKEELGMVKLKKHADFVVNNNGTIGSLHQNLQIILDKILT